MSYSIQSTSKDKALSQISREFQEKLNFKSTNGLPNGIKTGTTDVEIHCAGASGTCINSKSRSKVEPLNNIQSIDIDGSSYNASINDKSPPIQPSCSKFNDIPPLSPPHEPPPPPPPCEEPASYPFIKSVASRAVADSPCSSKSSQEGQGICNGYTVSEATSNASIAASSEFSISSERSTDSSFSGARPRTRHTSNSSSQSTQLRSDFDLSMTLVCDAPLKPSELSVSPQNSVSPQVSVSPQQMPDDIQVEYIHYENETQMGAIMSLIQKDLSEPYSIYTYRYFIHNWPHLCFLATVNKCVIGAVVCKLDMHKKGTVRGYIAMLAVDHRYRKRKIGSNLVQLAIRAMAADDADEVVLETEITNRPALRLYEALGFVRDKRLFRYYLNGVDALRLKLWLR